MIERVIENWLTSINERQYQIPFCQVLAGEGQTIIQISSHGPSEQGKDVISLSKEGIPCAFQLKNGPITLPRWREIAPQIDELVEYGIRHPSIPARARHLPFLVTNGEVNAPALEAIQSANRSWSQRRFKPLTVIDKGQLLSRFKELHGSFLPKEPIDFRLFLELFLRDGKEPIQKEKISHFLETILPFEATGSIHGREVGRAIASCVLLASYVLRASETSDNHWAVFEGWTLAGCYVLASATKHRLARKWWGQSFDLCQLAAKLALERLCEECEKRPHFVEGNALVDGHFHGSRMTLLAGLLSALDLYTRCRGEETAKKDFILEFAERALSDVHLWGESAVPFIFESALAIEGGGRHAVAENCIAKVIQTLAVSNKVEGDRGLPNPYYGPEESVRLACGLENENREDFHGNSYTVEPLIDFLARRQRRVALSRLWEMVTHVSFVTMNVGQEWEWLMWRSKSGSMDTRLPDKPQSWKKLVQVCSSIDVSAVPRLLRENPAFVFFLMLVYPHRFNRALAKFAEDTLSKPWAGNRTALK
ncbi:MAG TPA: hypothetical protein VG028_11165 [Terriglobia bacterium]|nr:hypothetical protein [Terriglobia bacterium]